MTGRSPHHLGTRLDCRPQPRGRRRPLRLFSVLAWMADAMRPWTSRRRHRSDPGDCADAACSLHHLAHRRIERIGGPAGGNHLLCRGLHPHRTRHHVHDRPHLGISLSVFCGTIACRRQDSTIRWHLSTIACITIAFGTGFLATWMFKWVLAAIVIGPEYVVGNVIGEMNIWTSEHGELPQPDWASWLKSLYSLSPQLFALLAPLGYMTLSSPLLAAAILAAVALCLLVWRLAPSSRGRAAAVSSICRDTVGQS